MMKIKSILLILLLLIITGCSVKTVKTVKKAKITDMKQLKARLIERIDSYMRSVRNDDRKDVWMHHYYSIKEPHERKGAALIDPLNASSHMTEYYNVKYAVDKIEIRGNRAKIRMSYLIKDEDNARSHKASMYDYWIFENNDWYYAFGGRPEFYYTRGWW